MTIDTSPERFMQRSLRQCLSSMTALLYHHGHVLETISIPHRGLDTESLAALNRSSREWQTCQRVLEESEAAERNDHDRLVLTPLGRELLFDMYGEGAADCA